MAWYWSDDVARAAIDAGIATPRSVQDWIDRPVAFGAEPGLDMADLAGRLLGTEPPATAGAA